MKRIIERYNLNKIDICICVLATIMGGILRAVGFNWDGGYMIFQPDEGNMVFPAIYMAQNKTIFYGRFNYPAHFFSKFQAFIILIYRHFTHANIQWYSVESYLICRLFTVFIGTLTIITVFMIGNYLYKHLGSVSSLMIAVSPMMVMMSKQVTGDVTALFLASIVILFALRYTEDLEIRYIVFMAIVAGMATMEKWHSGGCAAFIGVIIILHARSLKEVVYKGIIALLSYLLSIFVTAPDIIWNFDDAINGFWGTAVWDEATNAGYFENLKAYVDSSFLGLGWLYIIFTLVGVVYIIRSRDTRFGVLLLGVVKVLMMCVMNRSMPRWGLEFYLAQIIIMSYAICKMSEKKNIAISMAAASVSILITAEATLASCFVDVIAMDYSNDIRILQEEFCKNNGLNMNNTISCRYTAFIPGGIRSDGDYPEASGNGDNIFMIDENGELYKLQDMDYFVWSDKANVSSIRKKLDELECCIWEQKISYYDVFDIPYYNVGHRDIATKNDLLLCCDYAKGIINVRQGAVHGAYNIRIYDITNVSIATMDE